jgi:hypothetical protein
VEINSKSCYDVFVESGAYYTRSLQWSRMNHDIVFFMTDTVEIVYDQLMQSTAKMPSFDLTD